MGLFGKLEENIHHGGVKVHVHAPSSVPGNQVIPVQVTIESDSQQTINSVKAELKAQIREEGLRMGSMAGMGNRGIGAQAGGSNYRTVAQIQSNEPFTISPGETKTVNLELYLSGSDGGNNTGSPMGGALGALMNVAQGFEHVNYLYRVEASANVQGVHLDPNDKQPIEILPPNNGQATQPTQTIESFQDNTQPQPAQPTQPLPEEPPSSSPPQSTDYNQQN